jgi:hypothetical protein
MAGKLGVRATHAIAVRVLGPVQGIIRGFDEFFMASHFVMVWGGADADGCLPYWKSDRC